MQPTDPELVLSSRVVGSSPLAGYPVPARGGARSGATMTAAGGTRPGSQRARLAERVSALFMSTCRKLGALSSCLSRKVLALPKAIYGMAWRVLGRLIHLGGSGPRSPGPGGQCGSAGAEDGPTKASAGATLKAGESARMSQSSDVTPKPCYEFQPQCCQEFVKADAAKGCLFKRFGLHFPDEGQPTQAQLKALIDRTQVIMESAKPILGDGPQPASLQPAPTAEDYILRLPPDDLLAFLATAYRCNLYILFAAAARLPPTATLEEAAQKILDWLATGEARATANIWAERNLLTCIPSEIGLLKGLRSLRLGYNRLCDVPAEIGQLTQLEELGLEKNQLSSLPAGLGRLTNLRILRLGENRLCSIPAELGQLDQLQSLCLAQNQLTELPALGRLQKLDSLMLAQNKLVRLPDGLEGLQNLRWLDLARNRLEALPAAIGQLGQLRMLDLQDNRLLALPDELGSLSNLELLYLTQNRLTAVVPSVSRLAQLKELALSENELIALPTDLGLLKNLKALYLRHNKLSALPPGLGSLVNLKWLDLRQNPLAGVPQEVKGLTNLEKLWLDPA